MCLHPNVACALVHVYNSESYYISYFSFLKQIYIYIYTYIKLSRLAEIFLNLFRENLQQLLSGDLQQCLKQRWGILLLTVTEVPSWEFPQGWNHAGEAWI